MIDPVPLSSLSLADEVVSTNLGTKFVSVVDVINFAQEKITDDGRNGTKCLRTALSALKTTEYCICLMDTVSFGTALTWTLVFLTLKIVHANLKSKYI